MRRRHAVRRASILLVVVTVGACGRFGFDGDDGTGDGGGDDDDDAGDAGSDSRPVLPPLLIASQPTAGSHSGVEALAYGSDGTLAFTGAYLGTITVDGKSVTSVTGSFLDAWVGVVGADEHMQTLVSAGIDSLGTGRGVGRDGTNVTLAGYFAGTATNVQNRNSGSGQDIFAAVISDGGSLVTGGNWGTGGNCQARSLHTRGGRSVVIGTYINSIDFANGALPNTNGQDNGFIVSFPADLGVPKTRALLGGSDVFPNELDIGPDGSMCITGRFSAPVDFGNGTPLASNGDAAFVAKYDADLNYQWAVALGSDASGIGVTMLGDGSCVATGQFFVTFGGLTSAGNYDAWLGRFGAADGAVAWLRGYGGTNFDDGAGVRAIPGGGFIMSGVFNGDANVPTGAATSEGGNDAFLARFDDDGNAIVQELIGGTGDVIGGRSGVAISDDGSRLAFGLAFNGNLIAAGQTATTTESQAGAILFLPMLH